MLGNSVGLGQPGNSLGSGQLGNWLGSGQLGKSLGLEQWDIAAAPADYQPRARQSARCGRSAPRVVLSPWPG